MTVKTYDEKSYELAEHFLQDHGDMFTQDKCHRLALEIQQAVEDFIEDERVEPEDDPVERYLNATKGR